MRPLTRLCTTALMIPNVLTQRTHATHTHTHTYRGQPLTGEIGTHTGLLRRSGVCVVETAVTVHGVFNCDATAGAQDALSAVLFQQGVGAPVRLPGSGMCLCPNCAVPVVARSAAAFAPGPDLAWQLRTNATRAHVAHVRVALRLLVEPPRVRAVAPALVPFSGRTVLEVVGEEDFSRDSLYWCEFIELNTTVRARLDENPRVFTCETPPFVEGQVLSGGNGSSSSKNESNSHENSNSENNNSGSENSSSENSNSNNDTDDRKTIHMRVIEEERPDEGSNETGGRIYSANITLTYYRDPVIERVLPERVDAGSRTLVTVAGQHIGEVAPGAPVYCVYTVGGAQTYAVRGLVRGRLVHCQPLRWAEVAWRRGVALQISFNYVSRSASLPVQITAGPRLHAAQWAALAVLAVLALAGEGALVGVLRRRRAADGYRRIARGNAAVDVREIALGACVGRGSCADVYRGTWRGAAVAVKVFRAGALADADSRAGARAFAREVALLRSLRAPHVVQFLGSAFDPPRSVCIVTEYMARGSLHGVLRARALALPWALRLAMAQDAARGMRYLHGCRPPVLHRDLKSLNILVDEYWRCKVADFGLATALSPRAQTLTACGTPCWSAPEVLRGDRAYSTGADVYSFAVVLWEILARTDPYPRLAAFQVIAAVPEGLRPALPPWCPASYAQLLRRAWADRPEDRPDFAEILATLEDIAANIGEDCPGDLVFFDDDSVYEGDGDDDDNNKTPCSTTS